MTDHQVQLWTLVFSALSALGTVAAAVVAWVAASAWRDGLKQQRADEFVIAINDCAAAIGRTITRTDKGMADAAGGLGVDEAWSSWRRLRTAHAVACRYFDRLSSGFLESGEALLKRMEDYTTGTHDKAVGVGINVDVGRFQDSALAALSARSATPLLPK